MVDPDRPLVYVGRDESITSSIHKMLAGRYSQLPVMNGGQLAKGVIRWESIVTRLTQGLDISGKVHEFMETSPSETDADEPLLDAMDKILRYQYVLVRDRGKTLGIVTISDLSTAFREMTEPFILLNQIENHIRMLIIRCKFSPEEIDNAATAPKDGRRKGVFALDFGGYQALLGNKENWVRLRLNIDRKGFLADLDQVREIRNDVMHFDPDRITPKQLNKLQYFAEFLRTLEGRRG